MAEIKDDNYILVPGFARNMGLKLVDLLVYSIIYGFSQDGESKFNGSRQYFADWIGCTTRTVQTSLNFLADNGYITKTERVENGTKYCDYVVNFTPSEKFSPVKKFHTPSEKFSHHNIEDNIEIDNIYNNTYIYNNSNNMVGKNFTPSEKFSHPPFEEVFNSLWQLYPKKQGKGQVSDKTKRKIADIGVEEMTRAINRFVRQMDKEGRPKQYIMQGSTFFNSGYVDYLDCNYDAPEHATDLNKWFQILAKEYPNTENLGEAEKVFKSLFDNKQTEEEWKDYAFEILKAMRQYLKEYLERNKNYKYIRSLDKFLANDLKYLLMEKDEE